MPDDSSATKALSDALWGIWVKAGPISYAKFERLSAKVLGPKEFLARSTLQAHLKYGTRSGPPPWDWVLRLWKVLEVLAAEHHVAPKSLGTLEELKRLHEAALAEAQLSRQPAGAPGTATATRPVPDADPGDDLGVHGIPYQLSLQASASVDSGHDEELAAIRWRVGVEWWHDYRDVVPSWFEAYLSLEPAASLIQVYDNAVIPGLLQTKAYARAALHLEPLALPEETIDRLIELRMRRQQLIRPGSDDAPRLWAILDESAIRHQFGGVRVMRGQLAHLIGISKLPNVIIQVIPAAPSIRTTLSYPLSLLRFRVHKIPDIAYFEPVTTAFYLHEAAQVSRYAQILQALAAEALPPSETVVYLKRLHREL
jgi:hypothetical protein